MDFDWQNIFKEQLQKIGGLIDQFNTRVTMHPGQYTVLNSNKKRVRLNAIGDLKYHANFLRSLNRSSEAKIIIHIGGVYGDKKSATDRFVRQANKLPEFVRDHLIIENDDQSYDIKELLEISNRTDLPVVFDWLHHKLNPGFQTDDLSEFLPDVFSTWKEEDGPPVVHFSTPSGKSGGHHSRRIDKEGFIDFMDRTQTFEEFDLMLECKDKELALLELRKKLKQEDMVI